jgi:hypothetical protein
MTLAEWVEKYEAKAEVFEFPAEGEMYFNPEEGFLCYRVVDNALYLDHCSVRSAEWLNEKAKEIGRAHGCKYLVTYTLRSPVAFAKLFHAHLLPDESKTLANGKWYWAFEELI